MSNNIVGIRDQKKRFSKRLKSRKKRRQSRTTNIDELDNDYSEEEEDEEKLILLETLASLFSTDKLADVYFNVGIKEKKRIPAHRIILSSRSAVFERMLNGPMIESHSNSDIEVPDMEPDAFLAMLRFVYSAKSNLTPETAMGTLYAAKKYEVEGLRNACVKYLRRSLSTRNACMMYAQAQLFDEKDLEIECLNIIEKNAKDILLSAGFRELPVNCLQTIIQSDKLRSREVVIFEACVSWAESECERQNIAINAQNKRKVLNDVIPLIRFPLITSEEVVEHVVHSDILTSEELVNLFSYLCAHVTRKPKIIYPFKPRINFLIIGTDWAYEVMQMITNYTSSIAVGSINPNVDQPNLQMFLQYDAILVFSSSVFTEADELGDMIADYIDQGGGIVIAAIAGDSDNHGVSGRFERDEYNPLKRGERSHDARHTLGKRIIGEHPILYNVESFDGGPQSWRVKTTLGTGSRLIAEWEDGVPLIAEKNFKGKSRLVALNLWPPSRHISKDGWETFTHGDRLIVNSLMYSAQLL